MQNHESVSRMETKAAGRDAKRLRKPRQPYLTRTATALSEGGGKERIRGYQRRDGQEINRKDQLLSPAATLHLYAVVFRQLSQRHSELLKKHEGRELSWNQLERQPHPIRKIYTVQQLTTGFIKQGASQEVRAAHRLLSEHTERELLPGTAVQQGAFSGEGCTLHRLLLEQSKKNMQMEKTSEPTRLELFRIHDEQGLLRGSVSVIAPNYVYTEQRVAAEQVVAQLDPEASLAVLRPVFNKLLADCKIEVYWWGQSISLSELYESLREITIKRAESLKDSSTGSLGSDRLG